MKRYITYTRKKINDNFYADPNTNGSFEKATKDSTFTETPYEVDGTYLAFVEYPDLTSPEVLLGLIKSYSEFKFTFITEEQANEHLVKIGDVSVSNFVFTDNRPQDIF